MQEFPDGKPFSVWRACGLFALRKQCKHFITSVCPADIKCPVWSCSICILACLLYVECTRQNEKQKSFKMNMRQHLYFRHKATTSWYIFYWFFSSSQSTYMMPSAWNTRLMFKKMRCGWVYNLKIFDAVCAKFKIHPELSECAPISIQCWLSIS